jgi:hypothetical protein
VPLKNARPALEVLKLLAQNFGLELSSAEPDQVFDHLASEIAAFRGMNYGNIGLSGKLVNQPESAVAAD